MSKKLEPGMAYDTKKLNKVFAVLSILFFLTVVWVFLDDYLKPWKAVQIKSIQIERQKLDEKIKEEEKKLNRQELAALEEELKEAQGKLKDRQDAISKVEEELRVLGKEIKKETITKGLYNSQVAALTFSYEMAHEKHAPNADKLFKKLRKNKKLFAESSDRMKALVVKNKNKLKEKADLLSVVTEIEDQISKKTGALDRLKFAKSRTDISFKSKEAAENTIALFLRNAPFFDFMDPTLKIQQIVVTDVTDDRYFQHVPKVDRCTTCHTFIDKPGYEDQANPYKTHPKLDQMVASNSPHPMKRFGCTSCHGGEGHRVLDFQAPSHTPDSKEQQMVWAEKYHWHAPHKVPQPMHKLSQVEQSCVKCHTGVERIPGGTVVNEGIRNTEKFGCYGCHKIEGWEHKRKPGPSLNKIASKVSKEFFKNWVWAPKSFNKHAKMPSFFGQANNSEPRFMKKNIAEVNAMADFIWKKSKNYKPFMKYTGGSVDRGKELIGKVGCMGCHGVEGFEESSQKVDAYAGPYLSGTGSKVSADWLVSWLKKPDHYQEDTIMPSFRLSNKEANDITAYLMSLRNKKFEELKFEGLNPETRDEILITYFSAFDTVEVAKAKLAKMTDEQRTHELGYRSVGKYGCYSCHNIEGFDERPPIGPELSKFGSKPVTQLGFGHQKVDHNRAAWLDTHLKNPRIWDVGTDKPFKDLNRMPMFYMSDKEASSIATYILGLVADKIPATGVKRLDANEAKVAEGMKVAYKFNCVGCHKIDEMGGDILAHYEDDINEGPPRLMDQGHRMQTEWFHHFLGNVHEIRPWLSVRMPSFNYTNEEKNKLVTMFQMKSKQVTFEAIPNKVVWEAGERQAALTLFRRLECTSCHAEGFTKDDPSAPNLKLTKRRLRPSWVEKWLSNPSAILEGTVMPAFWEDGESPEPDILGGDAKRQIKALTKYLYEIGHDEYINAKK